LPLGNEPILTQDRGPAKRLTGIRPARFWAQPQVPPYSICDQLLSACAYLPKPSCSRRKGLSGGDHLQKLTHALEALVRATATEGAKTVVAQQGGDMVASTPAAFAEFILTERKRYETIVREAGMTVE
jgi:hypothetical protein